MLYFIIALCLLSPLIFAAPTKYHLTSISNFSASHQPAFVKVLPLFSSNSSDLVWSSFSGNPLLKNSGVISVIRDVGLNLHDISSANQEVLTHSLLWPNDFAIAPAGVFDAYQTLVVADGFLVPGKSDGNIYALVMNQTGQVVLEHALATVKSSYFYHFFHFIDLNGDNQLDILTARASKGTIGSGKGELLWLENPGKSSNLGSTWKEHILGANLGDVDFVVRDLDGDSSTIEVIAALYFTSKLVLSQIELKSGSLLGSYVIDNTIGAAYSVSFEDLDGDGTDELLVTNHEPSEKTSAMYVYDIPQMDPIKSPWSRRTIASGFPVTEPGSNQAAPGFPFVCYPEPIVNLQNQEPRSILLAGDGSQSAYYFSPSSSSTGPLSFDQHLIIKTRGTVGMVAASDVDLDGFTEVFVPDYDHSMFYVFRFQRS